jgi:L-cysteine S-thiosulfotransferase
LPADDVYALTAYIPTTIPLLVISLIFDAPTKPALLVFLGLATAVLAAPAHAQSGPADGQKLAFDRGKGNCLTCHEIKGGDLPGSIGPRLENIKSKYPDRNDLVAILNDETKRNPQTVMPPFGRNRILTEQEINAIVDFLQTL